MAIQFLNTVDLNFNQLNKAAIQNIPTTDPLVGVLGQLIYNVGESAIKVCTVASVTGVSNATFTEVGSGGDVTAVQASVAIDQLGIKLTDSAGPIPKVGLDIIGQTALGAAPLGSDKLIIYDLSTTTNKSVTVANLLDGRIKGTGTEGYIPKWNAINGLVDSVTLYQKTDSLVNINNILDAVPTGSAGIPDLWVAGTAGNESRLFLMNNSTATTDELPNGSLQFGIKGPSGATGGYVHSRILGSQTTAPSSGTPGKGKLEFQTNPGDASGSQPATALTIDDTKLATFAAKARSAQTAGTDDISTLTTKKYVDDLIAGGLTFKGTFNAATGAIVGTSPTTFLYQLVDAGTDFAPAKPRVAVVAGDYYVAATAGQFYGSGGTGGGGAQLDVGDAIIGLTAAAADASVVTNWSTISQGVTVNNFTNANGTYVSAATVNTNATGAVTTGIIDLSAVDGTSVADTRFLSKDNTWDVPAYIPNTDETYDLNCTQDGANADINLTSTSGGDNSRVELTAGANISLTVTSVAGGGEITIAATDTGALGKRVVLDGGNDGVARTTGSGFTTFAITVNDAAIFGKGVALDVKCEVITAAGQTVYADITRSGVVLTVIFTTETVANAAFEALLTYVG